MASALGELARVSMVVGAPYFMSLLVDALLMAGALEPAAAALERALGVSAAKANRWMDAHLLHLKARLILATEGQEREAAVSLLRQSVEHARNTLSRIHEIRSLCALIDLGDGSATDRARLAALAEDVEAGAGTADAKLIANTLLSA
jgi:hypothetical protein